MKSFIVLILSVAALPRAFGSPSPWDEFARLQRGPPATLDVGPAFASAKDATVAISRRLERALEKSLAKPSPICGKFVEVTREMLASIAGTVGHFKDPAARDDESFLAKTRLMLSLPSFNLLREMFERGRDGGFGTIDFQPEEVCEYRDREGLRQLFAKTIGEFQYFQSAALGRPGVLDLEEMSDRLLKLADEQQARFDVMNWTILAGTIVGDLVLYTAAGPLFGKGAAGIAKFAALGAVETLALMGLDWAANPEPEQRVKARIRSFDETMRDLRVLTGASFNQPQLYLAYLTATQAGLSALVGKWVQAHEVELKRVVHQ